MLIYISSQIRKILLSAVCLISVLLIQNKYQGTLGYQKKKEAADLGRTVRNLG
jgi:hypothetical protein